MSKALWRVTGSRNGHLFTTKVRAASWREAVRICSTTHMLVVRECALLDETSPGVLQAKCIAAAPSITPPSSPPPSAVTPPPPLSVAAAVAAPIPREPRERRKIKFTAEVLAQIPELVRQGLDRRQIAERFGTTANSLQVVCSRNGISLWRQDRTRRPVAVPDVELSLWIKHEAMEQLRQRAEANGLTKSELASRLLNLIASENLFDAVLDEAVA
jgi:hypothetical protein